MNNFVLPHSLKKLVLLIVATLLLCNCAVYEVQKSEPLESSANWVILPMINHSDTPEAGARAADIAATLLRARGIKQLSNYVPAAKDGIIPELDQQKVLQEAINWAIAQGFRYGLGGSVQEWRYKSGLDGEPAAGITLTVIDLNSGQIIWSASGSRAGWGRESVSGVAHKLMAVLIDGLTLAE
jgi:polysaccharide biosynthesis protein PelC